MALIHADIKRWTVEEYKHLAELNVFAPGERVELLEGEIVRMSPQNFPHRDAMFSANGKLVEAFKATHVVGPQLPIEISEWSCPEPDFVVCKTTDWRRGENLTRADLIIEVSDSSLSYDRIEKARAYANAGIMEYWIINVKEGILEVYREPKEGCYGKRIVLRESDTISPLCRPDLTFIASDLK